ncbi:glutathione S-transferase [Shewanella psychrotolerans]|uniref:glutathione S-transferase n=1 Tax=Shewanella psychrotolerans TaxID=2864206 RepID=UPI001C655596|nr:glutathione S-transferase [Shewanella psychrotolerans]QYK02995.1 glutathione S-transferase [Shewanella psychrotolerans]
MPHPILYSFRRCPYAMRARLGILLATQTVELREIVLKHKPQAMLKASPKGTVPVLVLDTGKVIDESLDIMRWALEQNDPLDLLMQNSINHQTTAAKLIAHNDTDFKLWLDRYKYADRFPEYEESYYRNKAESYISQLEAQLLDRDNLVRQQVSIADIAIFPFIRQFAHVNLTWWNNSPYPRVKSWLDMHLQSEPFSLIMSKYPTWLESGKSVLFGAQ